MSHFPGLFGIVNVTEDSFSDGGQFLSAHKAIDHARALVAAGAGVIDVGAASSHPDASAVGAAMEIERLTPVVSRLQAENISVSIDSFEPDTHLWAIQQGVAWLNDINGFAHPHIYPELAGASCRLIVMHAIQGKGIATRQASDVTRIWDDLCHFLDTRLNALVGAGISQDRLVIDPGMGFFLGDTPDSSLHVLARLEELRHRFNLPVLVCVSRKSFLRAMSGRSLEHIAPISLTAELWAAEQGVEYIRTHDVEQLHDALTFRHHLQAIQDRA